MNETAEVTVAATNIPNNDQPPAIGQAMTDDVRFFAWLFPDGSVRIFNPLLKDPRQSPLLGHWKASRMYDRWRVTIERQDGMWLGLLDWPPNSWGAGRPLTVLLQKDPSFAARQPRS